MAGTESKEREAVKNAYPGELWKKKVQIMSDQQIVALYMRLRAVGRI